MHFEAGIDVAAPAQHVFDVYTDVEHSPEWTSSVASVERLDQRPPRVGSRASVKQPRLPVAVWEVTDLVPGGSFTWVARGPGIVTTVLTKGLTDRYLRTEVRGLKARCER